MQQNLGQILRAIDVRPCPEGFEDGDLKARLPGKGQMLGKAQPLVAGAKLGGPDEDHICAASSSRAEYDISLAVQNSHNIILCQESQIGHDNENISGPSPPSSIGDQFIEGIIQIQLRLQDLGITADVSIVQSRSGEDRRPAEAQNDI